MHTTSAYSSIVSTIQVDILWYILSATDWNFNLLPICHNRIVIVLEDIFFATHATFTYTTIEISIVSSCHGTLCNWLKFQSFTYLPWQNCSCSRRYIFFAASYKTRNHGTNRNEMKRNETGTKQMTGVATLTSMRCNDDHLMVPLVQRLWYNVSPCSRFVTKKMSLSKLSSPSSTSDSDLENLLSQVWRKRVRKRLFRRDLVWGQE